MLVEVVERDPAMVRTPIGEYPTEHGPVAGGADDDRERQRRGGCYTCSAADASAIST